MESALIAADFPDTMIASKEFTPTYTKIFAIAKIAFWNPVGSPIINTAFAASL